MNNPKLEVRSVRNMDRNYHLNIVNDSKNFNFFIKMAYYYTVYVFTNFNNLDDEAKLEHIYYLLLNTASDYGLTYGDCLLKGLALDSLYAYKNEYKVEKQEYEDYSYAFDDEDEEDSNFNHKIDF